MALSTAKIKLNKCRRNFILEVFMAYPNIPSRINSFQLGRYSRYGEQYFRRRFETEFNFFLFNKTIFQRTIVFRNVSGLIK
ncbi:MAG: hypothetical protein EZS26_003491 [Candidatus Ordinivivax streblomastigis]|jgi:hypothetical protein|uniref:Uncharacterized protein n=1 Tax=Candidatus Ordinivivax streblomastigis TaxID=2540710 RepID=A0A5M8NTY4_9BACT|nr:MAG: hypothetical protein EZS26_003491 [Candidatus Ordinivivax streblomastigis]